MSEMKRRMMNDWAVSKVEEVKAHGHLVGTRYGKVIFEYHHYKISAVATKNGLVVDKLFTPGVAVYWISQDQTKATRL